MLTTSKMKTSLQLHASVEYKTMFRPTPWCPSTSFVLLWMSATGAWRKKKKRTCGSRLISQVCLRAMQFQKALLIQLWSHVSQLPDMGQDQWYPHGHGWMMVDEQLMNIHLPSGKLTWLWKITIFNGKTHYKWQFSIAMLVQRVPAVTPPGSCSAAIRAQALWLVWKRKQSRAHMETDGWRMALDSNL